MAITETAATYIGVSNENEFYSHHDLSEVLRGDIKATLNGWAGREGKKRVREKDQACAIAL